MRLSKRPALIKGGPQWARQSYTVYAIGPIRECFSKLGEFLIRREGSTVVCGVHSFTSLIHPRWCYWPWMVHRGNALDSRERGVSETLEDRDSYSWARGCLVNVRPMNWWMRPLLWCLDRKSILWKWYRLWNYIHSDIWPISHSDLSPFVRRFKCITVAPHQYFALFSYFFYFFQWKNLCFKNSKLRWC